MLIGVTGFKRSGKDSIGNILHVHAGFSRFAFADRMKDFALALDPFIPVMEAPPSPLLVGVRPEMPPQYQRLTTIVQDFGWEIAKENPEIRRFLQRLGTEGGRRILGVNIWVDALQMTKLPEQSVITDVRFLNEAAAVQACGGKVWRVVRPGSDMTDTHPSEQELRSIQEDVTIQNDGTLEDLVDAVLSALKDRALKSV